MTTHNNYCRGKKRKRQATIHNPKALAESSATSANVVPSGPLGQPATASGDRKKARKPSTRKPATVRSPAKKQNKSPLVSSGPPDDKLGEGLGEWPGGWTKITKQRVSGASAGSLDSYWISPISKRRLRSMVEVRKFLKSLQTNGGNEEVAWNELKKPKQTPTTAGKTKKGKPSLPTVPVHSVVAAANHLSLAVKNKSHSVFTIPSTRMPNTNTTARITKPTTAVIGHKVAISSKHPLPDKVRPLSVPVQAPEAAVAVTTKLSYLIGLSKTRDTSTRTAKQRKHQRQNNPLVPKQQKQQKQKQEKRQHQQEIQNIDSFQAHEATVISNASSQPICSSNQRDDTLCPTANQQKQQQQHQRSPKLSQQQAEMRQPPEPKDDVRTTPVDGKRSAEFITSTTTVSQLQNSQTQGSSIISGNSEDPSDEIGFYEFHIDL